jgi:hypothetical protein
VVGATAPAIWHGAHPSPVWGGQRSLGAKRPSEGGWGDLQQARLAGFLRRLLPACKGSLIAKAKRAALKRESVLTKLLRLDGLLPLEGEGARRADEGLVPHRCGGGGTVRCTLDAPLSSAARQGPHAGHGAR